MCRGRRAVAGGLIVMIYDALIAPFTEFEFMRRALAAVIALALGGAPIGVFLMLRRMSLVGDAMAHAILPGAAIGFLLSGLNLFAMTTGGLIAGFTVAILAGVVARTTELKEDASLATFYLVSLALGVTIVSIKGTNIDLLHVLFGNILAMDDQTLLVIAFNATVTLLVLAVIYRPLVIECVDPVFLRTVSRAGAPAHLAFLALVVINLVNGFHALGTLLGVGLMILPAGIARFWSRDITGMICIAVASAIVSGYAGLVVSFQTRIPSGPAIILVAAVLYVASLLFGNVSGLAQGRQCRRRSRQPHDFGRPRRRCTRLYASAGRRQEDRRLPKRLIINGLGLEELAAAAAAGLGQQAADHINSQGHRAAQVRLRRRSARLAIGGQCEDLSAIPAMRWWPPIRRMPGCFAPMRKPIWRSSMPLDREVQDAVAKIPARPPQGDLDAMMRSAILPRRLRPSFVTTLGVSTKPRPAPATLRPSSPRSKPRKSLRFPREYQRSPPDPADIGRDRREGRRNALCSGAV